MLPRERLKFWMVYCSVARGDFEKGNFSTILATHRKESPLLLWDYIRHAHTTIGRIWRAPALTTQLSRDGQRAKRLLTEHAVTESSEPGDPTDAPGTRNRMFCIGGT